MVPALGRWGKGMESLSPAWTAEEDFISKVNKLGSAAHTDAAEPGEML